MEIFWLIGWNTKFSIIIWLLYFINFFNGNIFISEENARMACAFRFANAEVLEWSRAYVKIVSFSRFLIHLLLAINSLLLPEPGIFVLYPQINMPSYWFPGMSEMPGQTKSVHLRVSKGHSMTARLPRGLLLLALHTIICCDNFAFFQWMKPASVAVVGRMVAIARHILMKYWLVVSPSWFQTVLFAYVVTVVVANAFRNQPISCSICGVLLTN